MFVHLIISLRETGLNEERRHFCVRRVTKWNYSKKILCSLLSCILIEKVHHCLAAKWQLKTMEDAGTSIPSYAQSKCLVNINIWKWLSVNSGFFSPLLIIWKKKLSSWCYECKRLCLYFKQEKKLILCLRYQKVIAFKWKKVNFMLALPKSYRLQMEKKIILCLPYQKVIAFKWKKVNFMLALPKSYRLQMEKI
mgnify:CR=1 FL=1